MANEPNDDVFRNLAKVMEEIISSLPLDENARFVGCTIISGRGDGPHIFQMDDQDLPEIKEPIYEILEGPDKVYITTEMPYGAKTMPYIDVQSEMVRICFDEKEKTIKLKSNDKVLFYTDGLTETMNMGSEYFDNVINAAITRHCDCGINDFVKNIYNELLSFKGTGSFEDDITIIAIHLDSDSNLKQTKKSGNITAS